MFGIDVQAMILAVGYAGLFTIVFAETGLLLGFFLPGDTLLITAGLMAQRGQFHFWVLLPLLFAAAVIGDSVGFEIGRRAGSRLFNREDSRFFKRHHLDRARAFYDRHGGKTIVIARFLAVIRTFAPTVAGAADMHYRRFVIFNATGAALWVVSLLTLGFVFGQKVGNLEVFFTILVGMTVLASTVPGAWQLWRRHNGVSPDAEPPM